MRKLANLLDRLKKGNESLSKGQSLISKSLVRRFKVCPICEGDFQDHYYALLAVTPAIDVEQVNDLVHKVTGHQWEDAIQISEFDRFQDAILALVLRCPSRRRAIVVLSDPYDPYLNPSVLETEVLDNLESERLESVMAEVQWRSIQDE